MQRDPRVKHLRDFRHSASGAWRDYWWKHGLAEIAAKRSAYTFEQEDVNVAKPKPNKKSGHRSGARTARHIMRASENVTPIRGEHTAYDIHPDVMPRFRPTTPGTSLGNRAVIGTSHYVPERAPKVKA